MTPSSWVRHHHHQQHQQQRSRASVPHNVCWLRLTTCWRPNYILTLDYVIRPTRINRWWMNGWLLLQSSTASVSSSSSSLSPPEASYSSSSYWLVLNAYPALSIEEHLATLWNTLAKIKRYVWICKSCVQNSVVLFFSTRCIWAKRICSWTMLVTTVIHTSSDTLVTI